MNLASIARKETRFAVGLSAGSSCFGLQAALVRLKGTGPEMHIKLLHCEAIPFKPGLRTRLLQPRPDTREVALLNYDLGAAFAEAATQLTKRAQEEMLDVSFVALQRHSLCHLPPRATDAFGILQIGEPAMVAERTGLPVVSDFAHRDMAAGGQGSPIGAYADWVLFGRPDRTVACLHLGGLASITVVTPKLENVLAFDIGPCTLALDGATRLATGGNRDLDEEGKYGSSGVVLDDLFEKLLEHRYFDRVPPKSTGRNEFGTEVYLEDLIQEGRHRSVDDILATVTAAVAENIVRSYMRFISPQYRISRIIISGGGALNPFLMQRIQSGLPDVVVRTSDQYGLPLSGCDGMAAAILGNETLCGTPANTPKATGVHHPVLLGKITPG